MSGLRDALTNAAALGLIAGVAFGPYVLAFLIGVVVGRLG